MRTKHAIPAALLSLVALAGCSRDGEQDATANSAHNPTHSPAAKAAGAPGVKIVTPGAGEPVRSRFTVKVKLENFKIDPKNVGQAPRPGYGHLHFQLDGGKYDHPRYSGENGKYAKKAGVAGKFSPALAPEITYSHIPKGKHRLNIYLAHNNHVDTGAENALDFVVE